MASPIKALRKVIVEQRSGRITIIDPNDPSIGWRVFVGGGQIHFAESTMGQVERLPYLLRPHHLNLDPAKLQKVSSGYPFLCQYWQVNQLPLNQLRKVLAILTQEALVQFLAIPSAQMQFEPNVGLDPLLLSMPLKQLILPMREVISQWAQLRPQISSPFQKPFIRNWDKFFKFVWYVTEKGQQLQDLSNSLAGEQCVYQLASQLKISTQEFALSLQPLIKSGAVDINPYASLDASDRPLIVCVDDSQTIQHFIKLTLESSGFEVVQMMDSTKALSNLPELQPSLILMDIEMPKIDGFQLAGMLRRIDPLKEVPIVMLTGREGIVDRLRARMAGATSYLTKPFDPQELIALVQKLTNSMPLPIAEGDF